MPQSTLDLTHFQNGCLVESNDFKSASRMAMTWIIARNCMIYSAAKTKKSLSLVASYLCCEHCLFGQEKDRMVPMVAGFHFGRKLWYHTLWDSVAISWYSSSSDDSTDPLWGRSLRDRNEEDTNCSSHQFFDFKLSKSRLSQSVILMSC